MTTHRKRGIFIQIIENTYPIQSDGNLIIPAEDLQEMGLSAYETIVVSFIAEQHRKNSYHEFLLSSASLPHLDEPYHIVIPSSLLESAHIPEDAELQIICIAGAIIIAEDSTMNVTELQEVIQQLSITNQVIGQLPNNSEAALSALHEIISEEEHDLGEL